MYLLVDAQVLQQAPRHRIRPPVGLHVVPGGSEHSHVVAGVLDDVLDSLDGLLYLLDEVLDAADPTLDPLEGPVLGVEFERLLVEALK